jgi:hypothetical protein
MIDLVAGLDSGVGKQPEYALWESRRLWSLWEMLRENADAFIELGQLIPDAQYKFQIEENFVQFGPPYVGMDPILSEIGERQIRKELNRFVDLAKKAHPVVPG